MIINAENKIMGRVASFAAKNALLGEDVILINCEKAVITGNRREIIDKFKSRKNRTTIRRGPFYHRRADRMMKRMIRGMLPYKQAKGRDALKRVRCYVSIPEGINEKIKAGEKVIELNQIHKNKLPNTKFITLKELTKELGAKYE